MHLGRIMASSLASDFAGGTALILSRRRLLVSGLILTAVCASGCGRSTMTPTELRITANEFGYQMPDSVAEGLVHITLHNAGRDLHEALLVRFTDTVGTAAAYA